MSNLCQNCHQETYNPKFCSRSCAASFNNKSVPKRKPQGICIICGSPCRTRERYCSENCHKQYIQDRADIVLQQRRIINKKAVSDFRRKQKLRAIAHKGDCCSLCGYNRCPAALLFHHLDPKTKEFTISSGTTKSWKRIEQELCKCILLCSNCHCELHAGLVSLPIMQY